MHAPFFGCWCGVTWCSWRIALWHSFLLLPPASFPQKQTDEEKKGVCVCVRERTKVFNKTFEVCGLCCYWLIHLTTLSTPTACIQPHAAIHCPTQTTDSHPHSTFPLLPSFSLISQNLTPPRLLLLACHLLGHMRRDAGERKAGRLLEQRGRLVLAPSSAHRHRKKRVQFYSSFIVVLW